LKKEIPEEPAREFVRILISVKGTVAARMEDYLYDERVITLHLKRGVDICEVVEDVRDSFQLEWIMTVDLNTVRFAVSKRVHVRAVSEWYYGKMRAWFRSIHNNKGVKTVMSREEREQREEIKIRMKKNEERGGQAGLGDSVEKPKRKKDPFRKYIKVYNVPTRVSPEKMVEKVEKELEVKILEQWEGECKNAVMNVVFEVDKDPQKENLDKQFANPLGDVVFMEKVEWVAATKEERENSLIRVAPARTG